MPATDVVIIGAGPAGVAAAVQCQRLGVRPLLLDRSGEAGGLVANGFSVENYPGLEPMPGNELKSLFQAHLKRFELSVGKGDVRRISAEDGAFVVEGDFGATRSRAVIVAVGTVPRELPVPGASELGTTRLFYEVRQLFHTLPLEKLKRVLVIGGGEAALDYSLSLARRGIQVRLLARGEHFRAKGRLVRLVQHSPPIRIIFGAAPQSLRPVSEGVELQLSTPQGMATYDGDAVIVAIGRGSRVGDLFSGLDVTGAERVSTEVPGLFIAGDARFGSLGQVGMAVGDGLRAAIAVADMLDVS